MFSSSDARRGDRSATCAPTPPLRDALIDAMEAAMEQHARLSRALTDHPLPSGPSFGGSLLKHAGEHTLSTSSPAIGEVGRYLMDVPLLYCEEVSSTMDVVRNPSPEHSDRALIHVPVQLRHKPAPIVRDYFSALARTQSAGRGRQQRVWESPDGAGVYTSLKFILDARTSSMIGFPLAVAVAVAETLEDFGASVGLKWPNDVWAIDRERRATGKLAGILIESSEMGPNEQQVLVGIGINLFPTGDPTAFRKATLSEVTETQFSLEEVYLVLLSRLLSVTNRFFAEKREEILSRWKSRCFLWGRPVRVDLAEGVLTGICVDLDEQGGLVLELEGPKRRHTIYSHEITFTDFSPDSTTTACQSE